MYGYMHMMQITPGLRPGATSYYCRYLPGRQLFGLVHPDPVNLHGGDSADWFVNASGQVDKHRFLGHAGVWRITSTPLIFHTMAFGVQSRV
jgi:hypothetical protein